MTDLRVTRDLQELAEDYEANADAEKRSKSGGAGKGRCHAHPVESPASSQGVLGLRQMSLATPHGAGH